MPIGDLIEAEHLGDENGARRDALAVTHHQPVVRLERRRERDERVRGGAHVAHETHLADEQLRVSCEFAVQTRELGRGCFRSPRDDEDGRPVVGETVVRSSRPRR